MRNSRFLFYAAGLFNLLLLCLTLLSCGKKDQQQVTVPAVFVDSVLSPDSVEIYYQVEGTGDGPALVFVHGWSCDRSYWRNQIDAFKTDFKTVAIDLAGHGASGLNRREWTMPAYGADVAAVVNQLELKKIILIGHSMGGAVIIEAARLLPEQTIALIGVDTYQDMGGKYSEEEAKVFIAPFEADFKTATDKFVRSFFPPTTDSTLVAKVAADMSSAPTEVALGSFRGLFLYDSETALAAMPKPIRSINSDGYPTNVEGNKKLADFEVIYLPGYGHFLHLENPEAFNSLLKQTIAGFLPPLQEP